MQLPTDLTDQRLLLVTGKLAAEGVTAMARRLETLLSCQIDVFVAKISVAALMTPQWLVGKVRPERPADVVIVPGWCDGDLSGLSASLGGVPVVLGPKDYRRLPAFLGQAATDLPLTGPRRLQILAEINHADRLPPDDLIASADRLRTAGADVIDLGCTPGRQWNDVGRAVQALVDRRHRVSIDTFDPIEAQQATAAGAELVLSVHEGNVDHAADWNAEVVVIPERCHEADWLDQIRRAIDALERRGIRYRIDPILEPIGLGFTASLERYWQARAVLPRTPMLMGVGNLTEMTEVDSAGVNALLAGVCAELAIDSVLTTQVAHWTQSCVAELAVAGRIMQHAIDERVVPKHLDAKLVMLRDSEVAGHSIEELRRLQQKLRDANFRIEVADGQLVIFNHDVFVTGTDPQTLFAQLPAVTPSHAFYLGSELRKAAIALHLGKQYVQDEALNWGLLHQPEPKRGPPLL